MALHITLNKSHLFCRYAAILNNKYLSNVIYNQEEKIDVDSLDEFTTQLMQKKSNKWEVMRTRRKLNNAQDNSTTELIEVNNNAQVSNIDELDRRLQDAIETDNVVLIEDTVKKFLKYKRLPRFTILLQVLSFYSQTGNKEAILSIIELCRDTQLDVLNENSDFKHFLAKATWSKGNIAEAITMFEDVYRNNVYLRRGIRNMLKYLIEDTVRNRSEAALVNIIKFSERLIKEFKDYYILACTWRACFLSEWFTDQCIAIDLLKQHKGLYKVISTQIPFVVFIALKNHQLEIVHRLLEVLLKFEDKSQCVVILEALFDYRVRQRDLRGCSEIIQWSLNQGITLPVIQQEKFVNLLTTYQSKSLKHVITKNEKLDTPAVPEYRFKF